MDIEMLLQSVESLLQPWTVSTSRPEENRLDVVIDRDNLHVVVQALKIAKWGNLPTITGLDCPAPAATEGETVGEGHLEALYHFCNGQAVVTLRVSLPYDDPTLSTICDLLPYATLYERELMELFGVRIQNTPDTSRLVLPDDWPDGIYPLRKAFTGFAAPAAEEKE